MSKEKLATFKHYNPTEVGLHNPTRAYHAVVCDKRNNLFMFGGCERKKVYSNKMFRYDWDRKVWANIDCLGDIPSPRAMFGYTFGNGKLWVFGGRTDEGIQEDLYSFDIESRTWKQHTFALGPEARILGGLGFSSDLNALILFGGSFGAESAHNDIWTFSIEESKWELLETSKHSKPPPPSTGHSVQVVGSEVIVFGGWEFKTSTSSSVKPPTKVSAEVYSFDLVMRHWQRLKTSGNSIGARTCHGSVCAGDDIWVSGGGLVDLDDFGLTELLFRFNVPSRKWTRYEVHGMSEVQDKLLSVHTAKGMSMTLMNPMEDSEINQIMLFGGHDDQGRFLRTMIRVKTDVKPKPKKKRKFSLRLKVFKRNEADYDEQVHSDPESPMSPFPLSPM